MQRILIFRNQGIGDLMLISPAMRAIRALHPEAHISVFVGDWSKASVEGNPNIDEIISYPDPWIQDRKPFRVFQLARIVRKKKFNRVYIFHSHSILHMIVKSAWIPERYGFSFQGTGRFLTNTTEWEPNSSRYIADNYLDIPRLAGYDGEDLSLDFFLSSEDESAAASILAEHNIKSGNYLVISPGGGINPRQNVFEKRWGAEKFGQLFDLLNEEYGIPILLTGAPAEKGICREAANIAKTPVIDLCGETDFKASAALVKNSRALICNDSAIMHTAVVFQVPSMAVFGPSNPLSLLPQNGLNRWVSAGLDCSPCYCNSIFSGCEHELACMKELSAEKVFGAVKELLNE
ncbi:MAG: glycosyltransferase family 9 protein [candidate division Zixibacteria bacterium]|nr:glycosyltransferase family 9 protein [Candidatus Tariuqbacter arcticus]